jgi:hypothetical protein
MKEQANEQINKYIIQKTYCGEYYIWHAFSGGSAATVQCKQRDDPRIDDANSSRDLSARRGAGDLRSTTGTHRLQQHRTVRKPWCFNGLKTRSGFVAQCTRVCAWHCTGGDSGRQVRRRRNGFEQRI